MSTLEIAVLIAIIAVFSTFAIVLAWVSRADGEPRARAGAGSAADTARARTDDGGDHIGRASAA